MADAAPLYLALLGPGALAVMVHCGGMCGPIVVSLRLGDGGWMALAVRLGLYQTGRALPLAAAGAAAGMAGAAAADLLGDWGPWLTLAVASGLLLAAIARLGWLPLPRPSPDGPLVLRLAAPLLGWAALRPRLGLLALGAALAALPCGYIYLALSLSAASGSPLHGALLPLVLVGLSTVPLALAAAAGGAACQALRRRAAWLPTAALAASAVLLGLHGLAALEVVPHLHVWKLMLW